MSNTFEREPAKLVILKLLFEQKRANFRQIRRYLYERSYILSDSGIYAAINQLIQEKLVKKMGKGIYEITQEGEEASEKYGWRRLRRF
ncbi:MAG: hypothetical protein QXR62_05030 [Candidatus Bathyarchaeia archaeon]